MRVVYATADTTWGHYTLRRGEHWLADDPVVLAAPGLFSDDPRYGLRFSQPPTEDALAPERQKRSYIRRA